MQQIFAIILLLAGQVENSDFQRQIDVYYENIEQSQSVDESVWALYRIYYERDLYAEIVISEGLSRGHEWVLEFSETENRLDILQSLALRFQSEPLQLILQLVVNEEDRRKEFLREFYNRSEIDLIKPLIENVSRSKSVDDVFNPEEVSILTLFAISFYDRRVQSENENFYLELGQFLLEKIRTSDDSFSPIESDMLRAAAFQALYLEDAFALINDNYDLYADLPLIPNTSMKLNMYWALDFALFRTGYIDRSLEVQRRHTIPLSHHLEDYGALNAILASHGAYLYNLGRYDEAEEVFTASLADTTHLTTGIKTSLLHNLSLVYYKLGDSNQYIENQLRALDFAVESGNIRDQLSIYRALHIYYRNNRNWDLSQQYIEAALELAGETEDKEELASILISKSVYNNQYLNNLDEAYRLLKEAELLLDETINYRLSVRVMDEMAKLYIQRREFDRGREIFEEIVDIGAENSNNQMYLTAIIDLANTHLLKGETDRARQYIREFNVHDITSVDFVDLVDARRIEAELAIIQGDLNRAERIIDPVYQQVIERARDMSDPEGGYWHVEDEYLNLFQLYADLLRTMNRPGDLVRILDQLKTINDASLIDNPLIRADELSDEELRESNRINDELDELRKRFLAADEETRLSIQNDISLLTAEKNRLTRRQSTEVLFRPLQTWKIQSRLKQGEMILHVTRILDSFYLIKIDNQNIDQKKLRFDFEQQQLFEEAIAGLTSGDTDLEKLYEIYNWLELDILPEQVHTLIVVPDSYLYQLPLDVLPVSRPPSATSYGATEYLVELRRVRYLNNLQDLFRRNTVRRYRTDFTGIGISDFQSIPDSELISLPKAPLEVTSISNSLDRLKSHDTLLETDATVSAFRQGVGQSRIVHLASHSQISEDDPLFSRIYLHPGSAEAGRNESGIIYAYQLFDMNLSNDLIMLNSCESGSGDYFQGAGIMGISRALRYAGAGSLVLNSWSVNDQLASEFAQQFYKNMNVGKSKSGALQQAKIHFLRNKNANPHFWGPYVMNGADRPVVNPPGHNTATIVLALILAGGLILTRYQRSG